MQVYAVWERVLPTDSRRQWDDQVLDDPRVVHLWDGAGASGRWFGAQNGQPEYVQYDVYLLLDRGAAWHDVPSKVLDSGGPIIGRTRELRRQLEPFLG